MFTILVWGFSIVQMLLRNGIQKLLIAQDYTIMIT